MSRLQGKVAVVTGAASGIALFVDGAELTREYPRFFDIFNMNPYRRAKSHSDIHASV